MHVHFGLNDIMWGPGHSSGQQQAEPVMKPERIRERQREMWRRRACQV